MAILSKIEHLADDASVVALTGAGGYNVVGDSLDMGAFYGTDWTKTIASFEAGAGKPLYCNFTVETTFSWTQDPTITVALLSGNAVSGGNISGTVTTLAVMVDGVKKADLTQGFVASAPVLMGNDKTVYRYWQMGLRGHIAAAGSPTGAFNAWLSWDPIGRPYYPAVTGRIT